MADPTSDKPVPILSYAGPVRDPTIPDIFALGPHLLVVRREAEFPRRCIICNREVIGKPHRVRLAKVDPSVADGYKSSVVPWVGPIVLLGRMIETMVKTRRATVDVFICPIHRRIHFGKRFAWRLVVPVSAALVWAGIDWKMPGVALIGIVGFLALFFLRNYYPKLLHLVQIDDQKVVVIGAGGVFLQSLPGKNGDVLQSR